jgi:hypothetical protein
MNVLVCDDIAERGEDVVKRIQGGGQPDPQTLIGNSLSAELKTLFGRMRSCKADPAHYSAEASLFDWADIVILDNNLAYLHNDDGPPLTAESIAGYIRAFTKARYIVSLNMNPDVDFDLRYLVGDFSTRADLAINTEHLENRALWTGVPSDATNGFYPWYWPQLITVAERRSQQIEFVQGHLDEPVLSAFDFDANAVEFLSLHARGALSPEAATSEPAKAGGKALRDVTFRDVFLHKDRSLPFKEDRTVLEATARDGNTAVRDLIARVVAADIDLWFRRDVVGPQEPLVDVPHLVIRLPFLLGDKAGQLDEWNRTVAALASPHGLETSLFDDHVTKAKFTHEIWTQRACFWWSQLKSDEKLNERFFTPKGQQWADVVFCEDQSLFCEGSPTGGKTPPVEFTAEFEGAWNRRYIAKLEHIRYAPRTRLAV